MLPKEYNLEKIFLTSRTIRQSKMHLPFQDSEKLENTSSSGRGRGRDRGRGRGRGRGDGVSSKGHNVVEFVSSSAPIERTNKLTDVSCPGMKDITKNNIPIVTNCTEETSHLNVESEKPMAAAKSSAADATAAALPAESVAEDYPGWLVSEMGKMAIDPSKFAHLNKPMNDDDDDYDEE